MPFLAHTTVINHQKFLKKNSIKRFLFHAHAAPAALNPAIFTTYHLALLFLLPLCASLRLRFHPQVRWSLVRMQTTATLLLLLPLLLSALPAPSHGWGVDGHLMVCQIAQGRLSDAAAAAVKDLLPSYAGGNLSSLCSWADDVKFRYHWSSALHYIDTPDGLCSYSYDRDCKDEEGVMGRCVAGAINNYTSQLLSYGKSASPEYNLTQALLFLSHFIGDIHQPLHVGFTSDRGGNTIDVHWYRRKTVLHHVWDASIIQTAEDDFYGDGVTGFIDTLTKNITGEWSEQVHSWEECGKNQTACPDTYATESITAACNWAYKGVQEDSTLQDAYFSSRLPIVNLRLAQGGVRLAATLNRIFG